jgi:hypothetical protein
MDHEYKKWSAMDKIERLGAIQELHYNQKANLTKIGKILSVSGCCLSRFLKTHGMKVCSKRGPIKKEIIDQEKEYVDFDYFRSKAIMIARLYPERKEQLPRATLCGPVQYQLFAKW